MYIYIYIFIYIYRLRLCRRPLFLLIRLYLIWVLGWFGMWHWIRGAIWLRIAYFKSPFAWFWDFSVFAILLMVSDSFASHFDTKFRFLLCFEAAKKTRNTKPFNVVVEFCLDLLWGPVWWQKRCHASPLEARGIHIGGQGCPGKLFSWIFIGFHWFQGDLWLSGDRRLAGLWRPVAGCGGLLAPVADLS